LNRFNLIKFVKGTQVFFSYKLSCLIVKNILGLKFILLPSFYFFKNLDDIQFIFLKKHFFNSFIKNIFCNQTIFAYFIKLRIRGLGYRLYSISDLTHFFFFNYTNYYYFFNPKNLLVKTYKKRMLLFSFE